MSAQKAVFPPKKKHTTKPRSEPVIPLTDGERSSLASEQMELALTHLKEARVLAKVKETPHACVHASYYAMYHIAIALILIMGGIGKRKGAPQSHETVIEHFGKMALIRDNDHLKLGQMLGRARVDRTVADYGLERRISISDAKATMADAEFFFKNCAALFKISFADETEGPNK